jgi:hypothetical protein
MHRVIFTIILFCALVAGTTHNACAFGEDVLAMTGQYVFFIKPKCSNMTYYQKMVPCMVTETCPTPRRVFPKYAVPVPDCRPFPVTVTETPVGHACGAPPCAECRPLPTTTTLYKDAILPRMLPAVVPTIEPVPRQITRPAMFPQWFAVSEEAKARPRKVK